MAYPTIQNQTSEESQAAHKISDLERLYSEAESCDSELFSEMRSNVLLVAGHHYTKKRSIFYKRIRDSKELSDQQKIRLTKNHIQKIVKMYANNITSLAPGVSFAPSNPGELQDQKAAQMHTSIWRYAKEKYGLDESIDEWADDFVALGECAVKIYFEPDEGEVIREEMLIDPMGQPVIGPDGMPITRKIKEGKFCFEKIHGFNLFRDSQAKDMKDAQFIGIKKMVVTENLRKKFPDHEKIIRESMDETMVVFDEVGGGYNKAEGQVLVKEYYFRKSAVYPNGHYYITTKEGILAHGDLPGGIFPIVWQYFDKNQTAARGQSPVKTMRPYQTEINRASSKIAEHQITLGDDKLLIQNGTKVGSGTSLPGVRSISYTGMSPVILPGRDGAQYVNYADGQIKELYEVMGVFEDDKLQGDLDPYTLLFRSASQKKKFRRYVSRFERFLKSLAKTYLQLAKLYMDDEMVIQAAGMTEAVNISEFKNTHDISYEIKIEAQADDVESKLGRQLIMNHVLQYVGNKMEKEDIGKIMRAMPYGNVEESFNDMTMDYDMATNDILALDRGELPPINEYDNHPYVVKRLVSRMRQADFKFLPPQIQHNYALKLNAHQQAEVERQYKIQLAQAGLIPTGGYLVPCDFYVPDVNDPTKTHRAKLPYEALSWLIDKLETQGQSLQQLENMNQGALAQMAQMLPQAAPEMMAQGQVPQFP